MNAKQAIFTIVFLLVSMHVTKCHLAKKLLKRIDFPQLGLHMYNSIFTTSKALKSIFDNFRTYFINIHPRLANHPRFIDRIKGKCNKINSQEIIEPIAIINPSDMMSIEDIGQVVPMKRFDLDPIEQIDDGPMRRLDLDPIDQIDDAPMRRVDLGPIEQVDAVPFKRVDLAPIEQVDAAPMKRVDLDPIEQINSVPIKKVDVTPIEKVDADPIKQVNTDSCTP
ncbi:hypothetical protein HZH66_009069 [Vespula vulgaris]|uniref:Uncharacterized protein n=1 Tax=Vespula vulgaris TaxID=7454 RepID=A0A834JTC8_VESVU|nr:hypothetical protein HZH66_009069 [Vespula vulgaris]